ncbi:MAG TPA: T9SS type A sorting domain-containing protein, partial [Bacteroidales bacterium]|nr:T9SS type A sorting domain-containing protein [Bacteroidales bacterium]
VYTNVGINPEDGFNFSVFPNPNEGIFDLTANSANGFTYEIVSADGKVITNASVDSKGNHTERVDVSTLAPGVYTIKLTSGETTKVEKLIIK